LQQKAVPSGGSNPARLGELSSPGGAELAWASWPATTTHFSPVNRGRRAEQKFSTLLVSENHLKLVRKIVSVKKI